MALAVRSTASRVNQNVNPIVVDRPAGVVDGDLLFVILYYEHVSNTVNSVPSGWTEIGARFVNSGGYTTYLYTKRAASEPATWSWGTTALGPSSCSACVAVSGNGGSGTYVDSVQQSQLNTDTSATVACPSVTTTVANDLILCMSGIFDFAATFIGGGSVASTENMDVTGLGAYSGIKTSPGATGVQNLTLSLTSQQNNYTVAILEGVVVPDLKAPPGFFDPELDPRAWY